MDSAIETRELSKYFHGKPAVDRLSLTVPPGSIFALLGDNGAGKTTSIRMLTGLLRPDAGSASILGIDCWQSAVKLRSKVGYVPEKPKFYDWDDRGGDRLVHSRLLSSRISTSLSAAHRRFRA